MSALRSLGLIDDCGLWPMTSTKPKLETGAMPQLSGAALAERTLSLAALLEANGGDPVQAWLCALRELVESSNDASQFDDILRHPEIARAEGSKVDNPLRDLSVANISVLYEYVLAAGDMSSKRDSGQFFTPDDVSLFMAKQSKAFPRGVWLDPCCGVGNLSHWLASLRRDPERFILDQCRFADLDETALLTARVVKALSFQNRVPSLFTELEPNFKQGDFLADSLLEQSPHTEDFDYIIMNPPYVQVADTAGNFETSDSRDLYAFFMERALKNSKGMIAITPQTFTNGRRHSALREILLRESISARIYCFDNVPDTIFRGVKFGSENTNTVNSTRAAVTVSRGRAKPSTRTSKVAITPLLRWRTSEREEMLSRADEFLGTPKGISAKLFPKVMPELNQLYAQLLSETRTVAHIAQATDAPSGLTVPTTPRYFISATHRDLDRSSKVHLAFQNKQDLEAAYLVLNSSLAYFWWRARDGGMTLSRETLWTTPIPEEIDTSSKEALLLMKALRRSEQRNLVVKANAGKGNENIKHPMELIGRINEFLAPKHSAALISLHRNSVITEA